jgi:hypothetical protein
MLSPILQLPEESTCLIAHFLPAPDVLNLVSTHPVLHRLLGVSPYFWNGLRKIQFPSSSPAAIPAREDDTEFVEGADATWKQAKDAYLLQAHCNSLSDVRWYPVATGRHAPTAREGHLSCVLGHYIVVTGGYANDDSVYVKDIRTGDSWQRLVPDLAILPYWAYGSTLTSLDDHRAVRFGGFRAGGYSAETYQVAILHLIESSTGSLQARWEIENCKLSDGTQLLRENDAGWMQKAARAYHTATLLFDRYLFILGGMQSSGSVLKPILLDCDTWTWYYEGITMHGATVSPSPRHGCSVVSDLQDRGRLVLFGGGDGSDLLRSGRDNTEVWELRLTGCSQADDLFRSLPWVWRCLHADQPNSENNVVEANNPNRLDPAEKLNLGRCHGSYRVGQDNVLLAFGSGQPTTNSVLGYNMLRDEFFRIAVHGPLPRARFTFASVFLESLGYLVFHGGFSTQQTSEALSDTIVLDLAPGMQRRQFRLWAVDARAESYPTVRVMAVPAGRIMEYLIHSINSRFDAEAAERRGAAARMFAFLEATQGLGGRPAMFHDDDIREVFDADDGSNAEEDEDAMR